MKAKKQITILTASVLSVAVIGALINPVEKLIQTSSQDVYTCELPSGYSEIDVVIGNAMSAGTTKVVNTLSFRGTVTRRVGDVAYIQRVNYVDKVAYGLRVTGVSTYADEIVVGNVVDFSGGKVYTHQGTPSFELTSSNDAVISYSTNVTGYNPITYQSIEDFLEGIHNTSYYDSANDSQSFSYGSNRLVRVNNVMPFENIGTLSQDADNRVFYIVGSPSLSKDKFNLATPNDTEYKDVFSQALADSKMLNITGYYQMFIYNGEVNAVFDVVDINDMEIGADAIDRNTVTSISSSTYIYRKDTSKNIDYSWPFAIYNIAGHGDVPYVEVTDFYNNACLNAFQFGYQINKRKVSDHLYAYAQTKGSARFEFEIDTNLDTITISYDPNHLAMEENDITSNNGYGLVCRPVESKYFKFDYASSKIYGTPIENYSFDLARYDLDIVEDNNGVVYVPLQPLNMFFNDLTGFVSVYNGKNLYYHYTRNDGDANFDTDTPWADPSFSGVVSTDYANYSYSSLCLAVEKIYGLAEVRGIVDPNDSSVSADSLFKSLGYDDGLKSTNIVTQEQTLIDFVGSYLCDGHTAYTSPSPAAQSLTNWEELWSSAKTKNERYMQLYNTFYNNAVRRNESGKDVGLRVIDNVAIITFDSFVKYRGGDSAYVDLFSHTYKELHDNYGTDLMFRRAFIEIENNPDITKVVIDLTMNGGGEIDVLPILEAYLTDDPIFTIHNNVTGLTQEIHFDIDINYDEVIDENDTYKGMYDFYLLTSEFSFSCGNYFPTAIKQLGAATIIGAQSGGGTCPVSALATAYGSIMNNSGKYSLGTWDGNQFLHNDGGVPVDYNYLDDVYYIDEAIRDFVNDLGEL